MAENHRTITCQKRVVSISSESTAVMRNLGGCTVALSLLSNASTFTFNLFPQSKTWKTNWVHRLLQPESEKHFSSEATTPRKLTTNTAFYRGKCLSESRTSVETGFSTGTRRQGNRNNYNGQRRQINYRDGGGGGGGAPVLNLVNPQKVQRIVNQVAQTDEERLQDREAPQQHGRGREEGRPSSRRSVASISSAPSSDARDQHAEGPSTLPMPQSFSDIISFFNGSESCLSCHMLLVRRSFR